MTAALNCQQSGWRRRKKLAGSIVQNSSTPVSGAPGLNVELQEVRAGERQTDVRLNHFLTITFLPSSGRADIKYCSTSTSTRS